MITYYYKCCSCSHEFEARQSIKDDPLTSCPSCQTGKVERLITGGSHIIFNSEPKTLGVLADRDRKKMGKFEKEDKEKKIKEKAKEGRKFVGKLKEGAQPLERDPNYRPFWRPNSGPDMSLAKLNDQQKADYILKGIKPNAKSD